MKVITMYYTFMLKVVKEQKPINNNIFLKFASSMKLKKKLKFKVKV